jgi:hypothetical protein
MAKDEEKKPSDEEEPPLAEPIPAKAPPPKQEAAPPPPAPGQPQYYAPAPFEPERLASNTLLFIAIILGLILILIGSIISVAAIELDNPDEQGLDEGVKHALVSGAILFNVGGFFLSMFLLFAGTFRNDLNNIVRLGMFITAGIIILKLVTTGPLFSF